MGQGGKRKGAGRPPKDGVVRKRQTIALREDLLTELTHQAADLGCSLSDRVNALLAPLLTQKPEQAAAHAQVPAIAQPSVSSGQNPPRKLEPGPNPLPAAIDTESVPSYRELDELVKKWRYRAPSVNRRTQQIQYWRKAYRKDKAFRDALDRLAGKTHAGLRDLLLDNHLPLASHKEVIALAELPTDTVKLTIARLLKGKRSLKQALGAAAETFRQIAVTQARQSNKLFTNYYFFEEL